MEEHNVAIKEKTENITNMVMRILLGFATIILISMDDVLPEIVTGAVIAGQPIILIFVSKKIEKNR